ncbi:MAG: flagellar motor protein MotA [Gammaproteobacteria bacterium RIFCSPLOWO2_02_FULL_47_50]|nr:MAG: flagellar motor protein MotA [Gammaproteobacteria bacterium RIFCSPLOWO2_01_FULL_47_190]OGT73345.1 MAG: flagellar motor protein MotA [Gammaproteobacteria bacterium RIFCSPLOWO2_12_47_11]OGT81103.1 MAG: flagellar motor protein MotA [Gammaproteobacteria bacterium RIFCSPLOWO2_02_FULL_47_50]OGT85376.1 MAG: flagellar motor protein MotA [Gammaproteobacteria bacterium RIFCSPLOWO2_12_FULL_47_76]
MKTYTLLILSLFFMNSAAAAEAPATIDALVEQVRKERTLERQENLEREQKFREAHDQQQQLLMEAKARLQAEEKRSEELKSIYEQNEREINAQNTIMSQRMGSLGELHGVVRQIANDIDSIIDTSLVSTQTPGRDDLVDALSASRALPAIDQLEKLWHIVLDELAEAGKVVTFPAKIITSTGDELQQNVTRIGVFNAVSNGHFLRYLPESDHFIEPGRQPAGRFQSMAAALEQSTSGMVPFPVDPTRGAMLALLVQVPDMKTRIQQGGIIGYMIIVIGIIGLLIALKRFIVLSSIDRKIKVQLHVNAPGDNPLGRIMAVYKANPDADTETLGLKLDEAILKETPILQKGLRVVALLGEIALLMGLLGTVTGIIETFQSITLFGTGDPRVMSGGISKALVTTVQGLMTAIPLLLLHSALSSKSNRLIHVLDEKSAAYVAMLAESHQKK